jgi:hypothetical protein
MSKAAVWEGRGRLARRLTGRREGGGKAGGKAGGGAVDREGGREGSKRLMERLFGYTVDRRGRAGARTRGRAIVEGEQLERPTISSG